MKYISLNEFNKTIRDNIWKVPHDIDRLTIYREITEKWLADHGIKYERLLMFKAQSWDERNESGISPEAMKGGYYKQAEWAKLFVESSDYQAQRIFRISGKPVFCVETNKLYS